LAVSQWNKFNHKEEKVVNQTVESLLVQGTMLQSMKQELLEQFQVAFALQISLWSLAGKIDEMLGGEWNVLWRVMQISTFNGIEREWTDSDLDMFISGLELYSCADGKGEEHQQAMMAKLRYEGRRLQLLKMVKEAVYTQRRFWETGELIANTLRWPLHEVFGRLSVFTVTVDRAQDLTEKDLADFLSRKPFSRSGMPLKATATQ
jgi:hypothetical protein